MRVPGVSIELGGQTYHGVWFQHARGMIELRSEYGAGQASLDGRDPGSVAREVLWDIVALYRHASTQSASAARHDRPSPRNPHG